MKDYYYCECYYIEVKGGKSNIYGLSYKDDIRTINEQVYVSNENEAIENSLNYINNTLCESKSINIEDIKIGEWVEDRKDIFDIKRGLSGGIVMAPLSIKEENVGYVAIHKRPWKI